MTYLEAIILGLVQGITEFIPISSSGHLVIASHILGLEGAFAFDTLLNLGTLMALIIYYRKRIWQIINRLFTAKEWKFILKIVSATIPAVIAGYLFEEQITNLNNMIWVVIVMLLILGILMIIIGKAVNNADDRQLEKSLSWRSALIVGLAQALALIPGSSRSGITILAGLRCKLSASKAAEFSFLLAIPIIAGASFKMLLSDKGVEYIQNYPGQLLVGNLAAFASGMLAISFFIKWLSTSGLKFFGWYRVGLAAFLIILVILGVI